MADSGMEESQRPLYSSKQFGHRSVTSYREKYGPEVDYPAQNYYGHHRWNSLQGVDFRTELKDMEESGACSPPLWTTSRSKNLENESHRGSLSPRSRTRAIIRGQQELMDMVKNMPETKYELTLKDLVEQPLVEQEQPLVDQGLEERNFISDCETQNSYKTKDGIIRNQNQMDRKAVSRRSGKIESGELLIKMAFPTYLRSNAKKKKNSRHDQPSTNNIMSSKVSPRPPVLSNGSTNGVGTQFSNKSFSPSGSSESGASTVNSKSTKTTGSSRKSTSRHGLVGCWSCIRKNRSQVQNDS